MHHVSETLQNRIPQTGFLGSGHWVLHSKGNSVAPQFGRNVDDDGPNIRRYKFQTYVKNNFRKEEFQWKLFANMTDLP